MYNVLDYLENSEKKYSDKIAVIEEEKKLTYKELLDYSRKVGSFLGEKYFNEPIIIFMDKGIDTLISFFGTVYSGCFYSLVNPLFPVERIMQINDTLKSRCIITNKDYYDTAKVCFPNQDIYLIEDIKESIINPSLLDLIQSKHIDTDPLYVNFTSGSTGTPKGVVISHKSVIDFIDVFTSTFKFKGSDIFANQAPFDFDVSVKDIYSSLKVGGTLVIVPMKFFSSPSNLLDYLCDNNVTVMIWAVSALCLITTFHGLDYKVPSNVRKILFSGEVMPIKHLNIWMSHLNKCEFINVYGPTEITCNCTYHIIDKKRSYEDKIPIGIPFKNERVFLLDEENNLITDANISGEICVTGTCTGLGYYNNTEQTDRHFMQNPLHLNYLEKIYRTGDLAYYNELGELVFNGRKDFQIKYQGHRIELEEIDKNIMMIDKVNRVCTLFDEEKSKLICFYIGDIEKLDIVNYLKDKVPVYMIPTKMFKIEEFPLTKNGKIDRKLLMKMYKEGV